MRHKYRWTLLSIAILIFIPVLLLLVNVVHIRMKFNALEHADHGSLLAACRDVIAHRASYRNDNDQWGAAYKGKVVILAPLPKEMPLAIRNLHPKDVVVT